MISNDKKTLETLDIILLVLASFYLRDSSPMIADGIFTAGMIMCVVYAVRNLMNDRNNKTTK